MRAYALDLRVRVLAAVDAGTPHAEIVRTLRVSLATIGRYVRLRRQGACLAGKRQPGMRPRIGEPERAALEAQLAAAGTDASLEQHCELWREQHGVSVSVPTMSRALARVAGWTHKKRA
jgi:transposase